MEKKEFKCDYILDLKKYNEFITGFNSTSILKGILKAIIIFCFSVYFIESFLITKDYNGIVFYSIILIFVGILFYNNKTKGNVQYKRMLSVNKGKPVHNLLTIDEEGIHATNVDTENKNNYTYDQVVSVIETQNLIILMMNYRLGLIIDKNTLTGGNKEELINFIFEKCQNIKRKKVKNSKKSKVISNICNIILVIILFIAILFKYEQQENIRHSFEDENYNPNVINTNNNDKSYEQLANILRELGITNINNELITQLEDEWKEYPEDILIDKMALLLCTIGYGEYDYTTGKWTPSSNKVYSFDMECFDIDNMYQLLFEGISSIGEDELNFSNIIVDTSKVDFDRGIGTQTFQFDLNGKTHVLEGDYYNDWYDIEILDYLNEILENENKAKKLYFMGDGYQSFIVFYCDKEWADLFEEKTGYKLITKTE